MTKPVDNDVPAYRKKKDSSTSKSQNRSDHKHEYESCLVYFLLPAWGERCKVCGRTHALSPGKQKSMESLLRLESQGKAAVGLMDYLSVAELKTKYSGIRAYEWTPHGYEEIERWGEYR